MGGSPHPTILRYGARPSGPDTVATPAASGCTAVYAANPTDATSAKQRLLMLTSTRRPIVVLPCVTAFTDANALACPAFPASEHDTPGTIHQVRRLHPSEPR